MAKGKKQEAECKRQKRITALGKMEEV